MKTTEMTKHFIPSHFFKNGDYEVWATKRQEYGAPLCLIAGNLTLETAKSFDWPNREIRRNGKVVT